jgi:hypothetical protein
VKKHDTKRAGLNTLTNTENEKTTENFLTVDFLEKQAE